ncbi:hypothetical protein Tco_0794719 [Tanacetum coccineum]
MSSDGSDRNAEYALSRLLQRGTVAEYQNEFEMLISRVTGKSESLLQTIYISGLKPTLQIGLLRVKPTTLGEAFSLARITEARFEAIAEKEQNIKDKVDTTLSLPSEETSLVVKGSLVHFGHHLYKFLPSHYISSIIPHCLHVRVPPC